jgi:Ca-activated chloride channel family protein
VTSGAGRRNWITLVVAALLGLAVILVISGRHSGNSNGQAGPTSSGLNQGHPRSGCIGVVVAASSEKAALLAQMATSYDDSNPQLHGQCVDVRVFSKASGGAEQALARGWDEGRDGGPQPTVWSPAASSWLVLLRQATAAADRPDITPAKWEGVAQTPLVIAMPKPMAQALGWPDKPIGWKDLLALARDPGGWAKLGHPEWGPFRLGKTDPLLSTSGLHALVGSYFAATGLSNDLSAARVEDPATIAYVQGLEQSVVHYGDTTLTFATNLQQADDRGAALSYISAVALEEKSVWDYNHGNPSGDPATLGKHAAPRVPLVAIYPSEGTLVSDSPFAILNAPWVGADQRAAAQDFLAYVQKPEQQDRFAKLAFRDHAGKPGGEINPGNGLLPDQPKLTLAPPAPAVLAQIQGDWQKLRKKARLLVEVDVSGSMGDAVNGTSGTKLDLVKKALNSALDQLSPADLVGVETFTTDNDGKPLFQTLAGIDVLGPHLADIRNRVNALEPQNGTPLYSAVQHSVETMRTSFDPQRINAVLLLTDGRNEAVGGPSLDSLVHDLQSAGEERNVRVFSIAYGGDADLTSLKKVSEATRASAYDAKDPASIDKVFTSVISNF